ncbi:hypothetical protein F5Y17DRAFT_455366 [Xylariaceae sp. FL0594]|nr:hypothetical protein F5Y17DRAFT_455366 [Xylariaceae sp. FL0594]
MRKLSSYVFTYDPGKTDLPERNPTHPKLVILAGWMDARDVHLAKYVSRYQDTYPNASIVLVKFFMREAIITAKATSAVQPVLWYMQSLVEAGILSAEPSAPEILVHLFSNGGSTTMQSMYAGYRRAFGAPFPLHAAVFDSCPGLHGFASSYNALTASFPNGLARSLFSPFIVLMILATWIWYTPFGFIAGEDFLSKNARILNDPRLVRQTNRTYIYGKADIMVDWRHVEMHARKAAAKGYNVTIETFDFSPHVAHMKTDRQRYWSIVDETWMNAIRSH